MSKNSTLHHFEELYTLKDNSSVLIDFSKCTYKRIELASKNEPKHYFSKNIQQNIDSIVNKLQECQKKQSTVFSLISSYQCNLQCTYCYEGKNQEFERLDVQHSKGLMNAFSAISEKRSPSGKVTLVLLGGEPLLPINFAFYDSLLPLFRKRFPKSIISCITNGVSVQKNFEKILSFGIDDFQITIDGLKSTHNIRRPSPSFRINPFEESCWAVDNLLKSGAKVRIRINIDKDNLHDLHDLNYFIKNKGWNKYKGFYAYLYAISENGVNSEISYAPEVTIFKQVLSIFKKIPKNDRIIELGAFHGINRLQKIINGHLPTLKLNCCAAMGRQYIFDPMGMIYPCWAGVKDSRFTIGHFQNNTFEIQEDKLLQWKNRNVKNLAKCKNCKYQFFCGGGCAYKAFENQGNLNKERCPDFKNLFQTYLEYLFL